MNDIVWNYDDIQNNLLSVKRGKDTIGYFRMDRDEFVIITDQLEGPRIHIDILRTIINGYDAAIKEAKRLVEIE